MQGFYLVLIYTVDGSSINCNDLDAGVRMKHAFLNKEVEIKCFYGNFLIGKSMINCDFQMLMLVWKCAANM